MNTEANIHTSLINNIDISMNNNISYIYMNLLLRRCKGGANGCFFCSSSLELSLSDSDVKPRSTSRLKYMGWKSYKTVKDCCSKFVDLAWICWYGFGISEFILKDQGREFQATRPLRSHPGLHKMFPCLFWACQLWKCAREHVATFQYLVQPWSYPHIIRTRVTGFVARKGIESQTTHLKGELLNHYTIDLASVQKKFV